MAESLFAAIGLDPSDEAGIRQFSRSTDIPVQTLRFYHSTNTLPSGMDLDAILAKTGLSEVDLMLSMGHIDSRLIRAFQKRSAEISKLIARDLVPPPCAEAELQPSFTTSLGKLYQADCIALMRQLAPGSVDLVFADPPFNLKKLYPSGIDDDLMEEQYIRWCEDWLRECVRILAPGGSLFLWNLPRWNALFAGFLSNHLTFRHWIAVDIKYSLPVQGRLYPSHYSLLYFCKGPKPKRFSPDRLPMQVCHECAADLRDYGGYKDKMNPEGVSLTDVWYDVPPVRHSKYKKRNGANELPIRLLDRVLELASEPGDLVFDPFGGSGTTFAVAEIKDRRWLGAEIGPIDGIVRRLESLAEEKKYLEAIRRDYNTLFTARTLGIRKRRGLWTAESIRDQKLRKRQAETVKLRAPRVEQALLLERALVRYPASSRASRRQSRPAGDAEIPLNRRECRSPIDPTANGSDE
ncbi:MAG TPA: site-specific DNA-methyltransferase [Longimicrobium sp.]|jgi:site-specific DNA-methyltransferase (adenine-specific)